MTDTSAMDLMRSADALSGVRPGMTHGEIRRVFDSMTPESLLMAHLVKEFKRVGPNSAARAEIRARMVVLVGQKPHPQTPETKAILKGVSITVEREGRGLGGRPRKHATDLIARRDASRAYRARRKATPPA